MRKRFNKDLTLFRSVPSCFCRAFVKQDCDANFVQPQKSKLKMRNELRKKHSKDQHSRNVTSGCTWNMKHPNNPILHSWKKLCAQKQIEMWTVYNISGVEQGQKMTWIHFLSAHCCFQRRAKIGLQLLLNFSSLYLNIISMNQICSLQLPKFYRVTSVAQGFVSCSKHKSRLRRISLFFVLRGFNNIIFPSLSGWTGTTFNQRNLFLNFQVGISVSKYERKVAPCSTTHRWCF